MEAGERSESHRVSVVMLTHDRADRTLRGLSELTALPEGPPIVVVDNASSDGTIEAVRREFPSVEVIALDENLGSAGRNLGVEHVDTPYVAFSDDDSWWAPGALARAAEAFDRHPRLGAIHARILVGDDEREDPICGELRGSPLPGDPSLPGTPLLGFLACAVIFRREAFEAVGGFERSVTIGGEEEWLACDLAGAGWEIRYLDDVVAHHDPPRRAGAAADARRRSACATRCGSTGSVAPRRARCGARSTSPAPSRAIASRHSPSPTRCAACGTGRRAGASSRRTSSRCCACLTGRRWSRPTATTPRDHGGRDDAEGRRRRGRRLGPRPARRRRGRGGRRAPARPGHRAGARLRRAPRGTGRRARRRGPRRGDARARRDPGARGARRLVRDAVVLDEHPGLGARRAAPARARARDGDRDRAALLRARVGGARRRAGRGAARRRGARLRPPS